MTNSLSMYVSSFQDKSLDLTLGIQAKAIADKPQLGSQKTLSSYDLFCKVASYLRPKDINSCNRVSRSWNHMISFREDQDDRRKNDQRVWKTQCHIQKVLLNYSLNEVLISHISKNVFFDAYKPDNAFLDTRSLFPRVFDRSILTLISEYENRNDYPLAIYKKQFSDPNPIFSFGQEQWKKYFGEIGTSPRLPSNIYEVLSSPCPFNKGKTVEQTHILVLIPETLNGTKMTLKRFGNLVQSLDLKHGKARYDQNSIFSPSDDDMPFESSYWVLMTRNIVEATKGEGFLEQQRIIRTHYPKYNTPFLEEVVLCAFMEYITKGFCFGKEDATFTRCLSRSRFVLTAMSVGNFTSDGLLVSHFPDSKYRNVGIAPVQRFS